MQKIKWNGKQPTRIAPRIGEAKVDVKVGDTLEVDEKVAKNLLDSYKKEVEFLGKTKKEEVPASIKRRLDIQKKSAKK